MSLMRYQQAWPAQARIHDDLKQIFDRFLSTGDNPDESSVVTSQWVPRVDIKEEADRFLILADLPGVDPQNVESIGRRALDNLEALKKRRVEEIRSEARRKLDPRRIEEIAEEAGKELFRVVERVAERVDAIVNRGSHPPDAEDAGDTDASAPGGGADASAPTGHDPKKVRIADE